VQAIDLIGVFASGALLAIRRDFDVVGIAATASAARVAGRTV